MIANSTPGKRGIRNSGNLIGTPAELLNARLVLADEEQKSAAHSVFLLDLVPLPLVQESNHGGIN